MPESPFEMSFDPQTIKHLGLRMYATLPPALAEIISNAYDADASKVTVTLTEQNGKPTEISVEDNGIGLSYDEINRKFLVIGRNRRENEGDIPTRKYHRLPTGKKGLGKLALFGLANSITILTRQQGMVNELMLDWSDLTQSRGAYHPRATRVQEQTNEPDGTRVTLKDLKRKSPFDVESLADALSRIFILDDTFQLILLTPKGDQIAVDNDRRYKSLEVEFDWDIASTKFVPTESPYAGKLTGKLLTAVKPIPPASGLRGITLFSRGKLVNAPEFFTSSTSSHFYQYLTGWISVDFIDTLEEDVIATNRQALNWENPDMAKLREFLSGVVSQVNADWRAKRKEKKSAELKDKTGIDTASWLGTLPEDIKPNIEQILSTLGGEDAFEKFTPVIKALHDIMPEYPELHWRHLHDELRDRVQAYYKNKQYGDAASQAVQIYCEVIRNLTGLKDDGYDLINKVFGSSPYKIAPMLQLNDLADESQENIQEGQGHLSRGVVTGFRNPISHRPIDSSVPGVFSYLDCLNIMSLVSYLVTRLDNAKVNRRASTPSP